MITAIVVDMKGFALVVLYLILAFTLMFTFAMTFPRTKEEYDGHLSADTDPQDYLGTMVE